MACLLFRKAGSCVRMHTCGIARAQGSTSARAQSRASIARVRSLRPARRDSAMTRRCWHGDCESDQRVAAIAAWQNRTACAWSPIPRGRRRRADHRLQIHHSGRPELVQACDASSLQFGVAIKLVQNHFRRGVGGGSSINHAQPCRSAFVADVAMPSIALSRHQTAISPGMRPCFT